MELREGVPQKDLSGGSSDAEAMRRKRVQDSRLRGAETLKRRCKASAVRQAEKISGVVRKDIAYDIVYDVIYYVQYMISYTT